VASIIDLRHRNSFEGQAAMELEFALAGETSEQTYRCSLEKNQGIDGTPGRPVYVFDWSQMIKDVWADSRRCIAVSLISKKFHNALVETIVEAEKVAGVQRVVLSGGCFQNRYLTEKAVIRLRSSGFQPYWHQRVPPNDGGISLGQIMAARQVLLRQQRDQSPLIEKEGR
jgi:hydrogenase maturation protein HypF